MPALIERLLCTSLISGAESDPVETAQKMTEGLTIFEMKTYCMMGGPLPEHHYQPDSNTV